MTNGLGFCYILAKSEKREVIWSLEIFRMKELVSYVLAKVVFLD